MAQDLEQELIQDALEGITDWENDMGEHYGLMNEWANAHRMKNSLKEKRPDGVSKNMNAETPRAVNALASSITRMQTSQDPYFELVSDEASEEQIFYYEKKYLKELEDLEFKRKLKKGNVGMCLFGTQVWEEPYMSFPANMQNPWYQGTDFIPLSLLQVAFRSGVYDLNWSDFIAVINNFNGNYLRFISNSPVWDKAKIEEGIKAKTSQGTTGTAKSAIETRRNKAGYVESKDAQQELILWHGRFSDYENPLIAEMWQKYGRTDDPKNCDITLGILNRKHLVRFHPTPYGTWHHMYKIGHYNEFELEPLAYGVGALGYELQKDMNRITRRVNDVALFSLYNMFFHGSGAGINGNNLNVFPWAMVKVNDVNQIREIRPQVEGILNGLKLLEGTREDFRGVTNATSTLQAVTTGATATESSLAQSEALRAVSIIAELNSDSVIRRHLDTMHKNYIDQNPFDAYYVPNIQFRAKCTTDKDFRPEHTKKLLEFLQLTTSIRSNMPLDFNPMPILKYFARSVGINPRELKEPRPQMDRMLDAMRRINGDSQLRNAVGGEMASAEAGGGGGVSNEPGAVPTSPLQVFG